MNFTVAYYICMLKQNFSLTDHILVNGDDKKELSHVLIVFKLVLHNGNIIR